MRKIMIIGAGGIGSFLIPLLNKTGLYKMTVFDPILTEKQMEGYDLVVSCVDNLECRRTLYRSGISWLDLRAQGRNAALVSFLADPNQYDTLLAGPEGSFSCQGDSWDGSTKNVHFMQVAIAGFGAQWIQRWFNKEDVCSFKVVNL